MPAPGAGGVQTSLVGTVQSMMASARNMFRRKPRPTPGAPIQSPGGNPPDLTQFSETFEPSGGLFAPGYPLPPVDPERLRAASMQPPLQRNAETDLCQITVRAVAGAVD